MTTAILGASLGFSATAAGSDLWADNGRIIYIKCVDSSCDPYTSKDDGTDEQPIEIAGFEETPTISENGKRIAFRQQGDIFVAKSDGTGVDNITETPGITDSEPDISPDGKSIAYTSFDGLNGNLLRSKIDGSGVKPILDADADDRTPEWSPDGTRIVFTRYDGVEDFDVFTVKKDGSGRKELTDTADKSEGNPSWSPDGERIALVQGFKGVTKLKIVDASGGRLKTVKTDASAPYIPSWSPNGKRLSFFGSEESQADVFTIKLDGQGQRHITDDAEQEFFYD